MTGCPRCGVRTDMPTSTQAINAEAWLGGAGEALENGQIHEAQARALIAIGNYLGALLETHAAKPYVSPDPDDPTHPWPVYDNEPFA